MTAILCYDGEYPDTLVTEADTSEELKEKALAESDSRGWEYSKCWVRWKNDKM